MTRVNMHEAKSTLSQLVSRALDGEDIVIAKAGKPLVRLEPVKSDQPRKLGIWKDKVTISDDFDAPLPADLYDDFEGNSSQ